MTEQEMQEAIDAVKKAQAGSDRKVMEYSDRLKKVTAENARLSEYKGAEDELKARLSNIEAGYKGKIKSLEMKHYAEIASLKSGVDFELVAPIVFETTGQIDEYVGKLSSFVESKRLDDINTRLGATAKPQASGYVKKPSALDTIVGKATGGNLGQDF